MSSAQALPILAVTITLIVSLAASTDSVAQGQKQSATTEAVEQAETSAPRFWWDRDFRIRQGYIAAGVMRDSDELNGIQLGYGIRFEGDECPGWGTLWLSRFSGHDQSVTGLRADMAPWLFAKSWGGIGPLIGMGLEYRSDPPHSGLGGFIATGVQFTLWTRFHWQLALDVEHDFGISSETRNQLRLIIAYANDHLTAGPIQN